MESGLQGEVRIDGECVTALSISLELGWKGGCAISGVISKAERMKKS